MRLLVALLVLSVLAPCLGSAATSLENARKAQTMLGAEKWSHVIEVTNTSVNSTYPALVHALVFEEGGLLWIYTDLDGTQSLSLYSNRLTQEKENLGPLLKAIDEGFTQFKFLPAGPAEPSFVHAAPIPNGCFIESVAALRDRILLGETIARPRLLSCYANTRRGLRGHTVLTYQTPQGFFLLDPAHPTRPRLMPEKWVEDPVSLAGVALEGAKVLKARWVSVDFQVPTALANMTPSPTALATESTTPRMMQ